MRASGPGVQRLRESGFGFLRNEGFFIFGVQGYGFGVKRFRALRIVGHLAVDAEHRNPEL